MTEDAVPARVGNWKLIGATDSTGKRLICRCLACGEVKTIGADALADGGHVACTNCRPPTHMGPTAKSFASNLADIETRGARGRKWGK
jgi:hypothetical protein